MSMGNFRGKAPEISAYDTLSVCLDMLGGAKRQVSMGGRGMDWEAGCQHVYEVFERHEENIRKMMKKIRYGEEEEQEKEQTRETAQGMQQLPG